MGCGCRARRKRRRIPPRRHRRSRQSRADRGHAGGDHRRLRTVQDVGLRPGVYTVTFALQGFNTLKREGIELTGDFTATVNAELKVGSLEETITVSGASPLVDVQSVTRQTVFTREVLDVLPAARSIQGAAVLIPGVTTPGAARDVGGTTRLQQPGTTFRGTRQRPALGRVPSRQSGGQQHRRRHQFLRQRCRRPGTGVFVRRRLGGDGPPRPLHRHGAEGRRQPVQRRGLLRLHALAVVGQQPQRQLKARGINDVVKVYRMNDFNRGFGGPIRRNKMWFYGAIAMSWSTPASSTTTTTRTPRLISMSPISPAGSRPRHHPNQSVRLTWQATTRTSCSSGSPIRTRRGEFYGISSNVTPDGAGRQSTRYAQPITLKWTRMQTNKLLLEGGVAWAGPTSTTATARA